MTVTQLAVLTTVLSLLLSPILVAIVAIIGLNNAKKTVLVLAIIGLVLFLGAEIGLRLAESRLTESTSPSFIRLFSVLQQFGSLGVLIGSQAGSVGGFLALIRTAQIRRWDWFAGIFVALIISAIGGILLNTFVVSQFIGTQRAIDLLQTPSYFILTSAIFSVTFIALLLYGIVGPDAPASDTAPQTAQPPTA
jgi:hypothetical protein